jgi:type II secretory pathway component PulJ
MDIAVGAGSQTGFTLIELVLSTGLLTLVMLFALQMMGEAGRVHDPQRGAGRDRARLPASDRAALDAPRRRGAGGARAHAPRDPEELLVKQRRTVL